MGVPVCLDNSDLHCVLHNARLDGELSEASSHLSRGIGKGTTHGDESIDSEEQVRDFGCEQRVLGEKAGKNASSTQTVRITYPLHVDTHQECNAKCSIGQSTRFTANVNPTLDE